MKKGFTLIELLAVIVILAIIALIATPIVLNIIDDSKKNATKRSAEMYLNAVEYAIADVVTNKGGLKEGNYYITEEGDLCSIEKTTNGACGKENLIEIKMKGEKPKTGTIYVKGSKINTAEITISEKTIEKTEDGKIVLKEEIKEEKAICTLVNDTGAEGITPGDKYICEVKLETYYTFFVLSSNEDGTYNLIMDSNINELGQEVKTNEIENKGFVAWINESDYVLNGGENWSSSKDNNRLGPITAMNYLQNITSNWINLNKMIIDTVYTETEITYSMKKTYESYARLPYYSEVKAQGCCEVNGENCSNDNCPLWLVDYGHSNANYEDYHVINRMGGYWLLSVLSTSNTVAWGLRYNGMIATNNVNYTDLYGVRPVINVKL